jgi:peptide/nickel transport system substrate-binding protein
MTHADMGSATGRKARRKFGLKAATSVAAVAGLAALTACGSSSSGSGTTLSGMSGAGMYGSLPAASGTEHTGMLKIALLGGSPPTWILPMQTASSGTVYNDYDFDYQLYRPLYWTVNGTQPKETPALSLADDPVWSDGYKTATITMKNYKWSDGKPVTSQDIAFFLYELKAAIKESAANWNAYSQGLSLPDDLASVATPNAKTLVIHLTHAVNPSWFTEDELGVTYPMPAHAWAKASANGPILDYTNPANAKKIYDFLVSQSKSLSTYATNPLWKVVDGPYKLSQFNSTTGDYTMVPNTAYSGPHAKVVSPFTTITYTSDSAEFTALKAGAVDLGWVPNDDVPEAPSVAAQYRLWGYPGFGWQGAMYNFKDKTGDFDNIISQLYIRQALAHLVDQNGIVKAYLHGAGTPGYSVVGQYPLSPFTPSNAYADPYPYSPTAATNLLKQHGWSVVPGGTDTCQKPGTAADECGAGIPAGTKLAWNLVYASSVSLGQEMVTNLASVARSVGIEISLKADSFNDIVANDNNVSAPANENKWAMSDFGGFSDSTYPTTEGLFNTGGSYDMGSYSDPHLDKLVNASVYSSDPTAVKNELAYVTIQQPVMFQPNPDWDGNDAGIMAISKQISGPPAYFADYSQYMLTPEFWYFTK